MGTCPEGYTEADIIQQGIGAPASPEDADTDHRDAFQHDADRILYSPEFRALAGKTQVVAADDSGVFHNRLTHSLKVAQLGRRMTQLLTAKAQPSAAADPRVIGPSPDLVEAACLLHDIGHPPFGHIGEEALCAAIDEATAGLDDDGFQANAQNFRIAISLSCRSGLLTDQAPGLNLTNAVLDSTLKYPWKRDNRAVDRDKCEGVRHWCVYTETEGVALSKVLRDRSTPVGDHPGFAVPEPGQTSTVQRPVEEQIMDWADEISYVCHDLEDFTKAGLIPLEDIMAGVTVVQTSRANADEFSPNMAEIDRFWTHLAKSSRPAPQAGATPQASLEAAFTALSGLWHKGNSLFGASRE